MAGDKHGAAFDPAILKWADMNKDRYKYFRMTPRAAKLSFIYMLFVPSLLAVLAFRTEGKYEMRGKRRGDTAKEF